MKSQLHKSFYTPRISQSPLALRETPNAQMYILEKEINSGILNKRNAKPWVLQLHLIDSGLSDFGYKKIKESIWNPDYAVMGRLKGLTLSVSNENDDQYKLPNFSFGGGILGGQAYLNTNTGFELNTVSDGTLRMNRRWSENIFKDFLCRDLPVLSESDVINSVNQNSSLSFRKSANCMRCHATMDNLAAGVRNLVPSWTGFTNKEPFIAKVTRKMPLHDTTNSPLLREQPDPQYSHQTPIGLLVYRDLNDQLIQFHFSNLDELGKYLSNTKDFYYCLTKRYVTYFTGYEFDLTKLSDSSDEAQEFKVLAENFYKHQNQKQLIMEVLDSSIFRKNINQ